MSGSLEQWEGCHVSSSFGLCVLLKAGESNITLYTPKHTYCLPYNSILWTLEYPNGVKHIEIVNSSSKKESVIEPSLFVGVNTSFEIHVDD